MELNKETALLQAEFRKFARDVLAAKADEYDKKCEVPGASLKRLADLGMLGALVPESCGGVNLDTLGTVVALEEIAKVCPSTALILAVHNALFAYPLVKYGSKEQQDRYFPKACGGAIIGGFTETAASKLAVRVEGEQLVIDGENPFLLNGELKGAFVVNATGDQPGSRLTLVVDAATPGVEIAKNDRIIGMKAAGIAEVKFNRVALAKTSRIEISTDDVAAITRLLYAAVTLGIAQGAYEHALKYAKERVQFGEPIGNYGMVREMIVDMATKIEALRLLVYDAAITRDGQKDFGRSAAMARLIASQAVAEITTNAIQVYGGYGYMKDYPVERYFRDAQVIRVLGGSQATEKEAIASRII